MLVRLEDVLKKNTTAAAELELERLEDSQTLSSVFPHLKSIGRNTLLLEDAGNLPDILYYLGDKRIPILRIERKEASLEELFMEVVGK